MNPHEKDHHRSSEEATPLPLHKPKNGQPDDETERLKLDEQTIEMLRQESESPTCDDARESDPDGVMKPLE